MFFATVVRLLMRNSSRVFFTQGGHMDQGKDRERRIAEGVKTRSIAQERQAQRTAEIAGKQAQLKLEAQKRAEQRSKSA
jgi:hypothetical protein